MLGPMDDLNLDDLAVLVRVVDRGGARAPRARSGADLVFVTPKRKSSS
jgi:hypothetical protein